MNQIPREKGETCLTYWPFPAWMVFPAQYLTAWFEPLVTRNLPNLVEFFRRLFFLVGEFFLVINDHSAATIAGSWFKELLFEVFILQVVVDDPSTKDQAASPTSSCFWLCLGWCFNVCQPASVFSGKCVTLKTIGFSCKIKSPHGWRSWKFIIWGPFICWRHESFPPKTPWPNEIWN